MNWPWDIADDGRIKRASKVKFQSVQGYTAIAFSGSSNKTYSVSLTGCTCDDFHKTLHGEQPCKHILRLGMELGLINKYGRTPQQQREEDIFSTKEQIARAAGYYYVFGKSIITDDEYDALKRKLDKLLKTQ